MTQQLKKRTPHILLLYILCSTLAACTDTFELYHADKRSAIVLNSLLNTDSVAYARLTWMNKPGEMGTYWVVDEITDAAVSLYENGQLIEQLVPVTVNGNAYYKGGYRLRQGQTYRLAATSADGQQVAGQGWTPAYPSFSIGPAVRASSPSSGWGEETRIPVQLNDPAGERNYYRIRLVYTSRNTPQRWFQSITWIGPGKQETNFFSEEFRSSIFIDDELFDGQQVELIVRCQNSLYDDNTRLEVTALTQESYQYLRSQAFADEAVDNFLTEPIPVLSNIDNGLGFVGGVAVLEQPVEYENQDTP